VIHEGDEFASGHFQGRAAGGGDMAAFGATFNEHLGGWCKAASGLPAEASDDDFGFQLRLKLNEVTDARCCFFLFLDLFS
jgi:hypothetical protein